MLKNCRTGTTFKSANYKFIAASFDEEKTVSFTIIWICKKSKKKKKKTLNSILMAFIQSHKHIFFNPTIVIFYFLPLPSSLANNRENPSIVCRQIRPVTNFLTYAITVGHDFTLRCPVPQNRVRQIQCRSRQDGISFSTGLIQ